VEKRRALSDAAADIFFDFINASGPVHRTFLKESFPPDLSYQNAAGNESCGALLRASQLT
jgi:hypothetical protein